MGCNSTVDVRTIEQVEADMRETNYGISGGPLMAEPV
jgi:hypothetical protein